MKKLLFAFAITGFLFSCSSDDDAKNDPLVGTWEAKTISYEFGGHGGTYPFDHEIFKEGCATDYLTISGNGTAELKENNRIDDECVDQFTAGTWNGSAITLDGGEVRHVEYVDEEELELVYPLTFMGSTLDVTVVYSRK